MKLFTIPLLAAALIAPLSCSSEQSIGDDFSREGGANGQAGSPVDASLPPEDGNTTSRPDGAACVRTGNACALPDDCCSHFCIDHVCTEFGACQSATTACTNAGSCCSGRCEPITGTTSRRCLDYCRADGVACEKALDCCTLGCFGGKCGGGLCRIESEPCTTNAECCSNICDTSRGQCQIDRVNPDCRPTGETCTSGTGSGCCEVCNKSTDRCEFGPSTCRAQGTSCTKDADCCKGKCLPNDSGQLVCQTPCSPDGQPCSMSAQCCGFNCAGTPARCQPPGASPDAGESDGAICKRTGLACTAASECCSHFCIAGFCDVPCALVGSSCRAGADCCSGVCTTTNVCADLPPR